MAEEETIKQWQKILDESSRYQIEDNETFLDLCHYPGERFEEICSRVLKFFFDPNEKHGFRDLWFNALCQTINDKYEKQNNNKKIESEYFYYKFSMEITTEESTSYADITNKRIDIVLKTPTLVIGIENKINAQLYNDLDQYKKHIYGKYKDENISKILVVLTARDLNTNEGKKTKENGFVVIKYDDLFNNVTSLLGKYVAKCDQKYLSFMLDFIQTVKNRANIMEETEMDKFFADNNAEILKLIEKHNLWKWKRWTIYLEKSKELNDYLLKKINETTNEKWWITTDSRTIGFCVIDDTRNGLLRIDSQFDYNDGNNPLCGICNIQFTLLTKGNQQYEQKIGEKFPPSNSFEGKNKQKHLQMPPIKLKDYNDNFDAYKEEIIKKLKEYYDFLKEITDNIDK